MKFASLCFLFQLTCLSFVIVARLAVFEFVREWIGTDLARDQVPMMNIPDMLLPGSKGNGNEASEDGNGVTISDVIGKERIIGIFAGFTRDIDTVAQRLDDGSHNTTILAPTNGELQKLPRKPWEDPEDYQARGRDAYTGASGEDRAHQNLRRFVEAHVVPASPWKSGEKIQSMAGGKVWWEEVDGKKMVHASRRSPTMHAP